MKNELIKLKTDNHDYQSSISSPSESRNSDLREVISEKKELDKVTFKKNVLKYQQKVEENGMSGEDSSSKLRISSWDTNGAVYCHLKQINYDSEVSQPAIKQMSPNKKINKSLVKKLKFPSLSRTPLLHPKKAGSKYKLFKYFDKTHLIFEKYHFLINMELLVIHIKYILSFLRIFLNLSL